MGRISGTISHTELKPALECVPACYEVGLLPVHFPGRVLSPTCIIERKGGEGSLVSSLGLKVNDLLANHSWRGLRVCGTLGSESHTVQALKGFIRQQER